MAFLLCWTAAVVEEGTMTSYAQRPSGDPVQRLSALAIDMQAASLGPRQTVVTFEDRYRTRTGDYR